MTNSGKMDGYRTCGKMFTGRLRHSSPWYSYDIIKNLRETYETKLYGLQPTKHLPLLTSVI